MVHEATFDDRSAQMAIPRGHSTARMAGAFAAQCHAKSLLLTHFSARLQPRARDPRDMALLEKQGKGVAADASCVFTHA
jgi:ribonuclease BN (tRNA processing enzyme)